MRSELRGCAGFRDLSPGFRDLSPGFRDFWNLVSHHCGSFYGPSGFRNLHQGPGILRLVFPFDLCFPSLCFFWFRDLSPEFQDLSPGILGLLEPCLPSLCFFWFVDLFPGFRDFWNFVSHHCFCFVVHQGAGLHQGSGILGLLSPIIVFFLVVYQGSGIFGTLSPIIVFVLWSIRARDFIRVSGILGLLSPIIVFFLVPGLVSRVPGLVSRDSGTFGTLSPIIVFVLWSIRAWDFIRVPGLLGTFVSQHCSLLLVVFQGPGISGTLSPSIVFGLWYHQGMRDFIRVSGFLDFCFPSLCFFWFRDLSPGFRDLSPGFRDFWNLVSHHCVPVSCWFMSSGSGAFWKFVSHHCVCSVVHEGAGLHQGSGTSLVLVPGLVSHHCLLLSVVLRAPGFLVSLVVSHHCVCSVVHQGALHCVSSGSGVCLHHDFQELLCLVPGLVSRVPGLLEPCLLHCLPSCLFFFFIVSHH